MMLGTAGFTALLCSFAVKAKEELLLGEKVKDVLVTGATGGVGSIADIGCGNTGFSGRDGTNRTAAGHISPHNKSLDTDSGTLAQQTYTGSALT